MDVSARARDSALGERAPRVLVCGTVLGQPMGGVVRHNMEILPRAATLLADRGGALAVMEGRDPAAFPLPAPIERIATDTPARPLLARTRRESANLARILEDAARGGRPFDLVHTAHIPAPIALRVPYTLTIHDLRRLDPRLAKAASRFVAGLVIRGAVERAAAVITVSEAVRQEILERFHIDGSRVTVVPNAADHLTPRPRRAAADAPITCIGHLEPRKNLDLVLRALAVDRSLPRVLLAGAAKGDEERRLRALATELEVVSRVTFRGAFADSELADLYAEAACIVLPSHVEGFGIVALEAQRARVPLCVARASALREVAGSEVIDFAATSPEECASAMRRALAITDRELDRAEQNAARYRWESSAQLHAEVWNAVGARA